jgi:hypothetical protein
MSGNYDIHITSRKDWLNGNVNLTAFINQGSSMEYTILAYSHV